MGALLTAAAASAQTPADQVSCWFITTEFDEFTQLRQETLLGLMKVVEQHGADFAFPTRTLQLEPTPAPAADAAPAFSGHRWDLPPQASWRDSSAG